MFSLIYNHWEKFTNIYGKCQKYGHVRTFSLTPPTKDNNFKLSISNDILS